MGLGLPCPFSEVKFCGRFIVIFGVQKGSGKYKGRPKMTIKRPQALTDKGQGRPSPNTRKLYAVAQGWPPKNIAPPPIYQEGRRMGSKEVGML